MSRKRVFISMPIIGLGKADGDRAAPTIATMTRQVGEWLSGIDSSASPRGIATAARAMRALDGAGYEGVLHIIPNCSILSQARSFAAKSFLASGCEWLLHVDDDIGAAGETIVDLVEAGGAFVVCAYPQRLNPSTIVVSEFDVLDVRRTARGRRVVPITGAGLGLALVHRQVIAALWDRLLTHPDFVFDDQDGKPAVWMYREAIIDRGGRRSIVGEDIAFMHRARELGFPVECLLDAEIDHNGHACNLGAIVDAGAIRRAGGDDDLVPHAAAPLRPAGEMRADA